MISISRVLPTPLRVSLSVEVSARSAKITFRPDLNSTRLNDSFVAEPTDLIKVSPSEEFPYQETPILEYRGGLALARTFRKNEFLPFLAPDPIGSRSSSDGRVSPISLSLALEVMILAGCVLSEESSVEYLT